MIQNSSSSQAAELSSIENNSNQLGALLMFASSNLPIGSYTYSQGVEAAIEAGLINDEHSMLAWMQDYQALALMGFELPLIVALAELLARDAKMMRGDKPFVFSNMKSGDGLDDIIEFIEDKGMLRR